MDVDELRRAISVRLAGQEAVHAAVMVAPTATEDRAEAKQEMPDFIEEEASTVIDEGEDDEIDEEASIVREEVEEEAVEDALHTLLQRRQAPATDACDTISFDVAWKM